MTSKLTRGQAEDTIEGLEGLISRGLQSVYLDMALAGMRQLLAAMDSELEILPLDYLQGHKDGLEWAAQLAEADHPETGDWLYDDSFELAKAIRKGPDMPPVQTAPVVPDAYVRDERGRMMLNGVCEPKIGFGAGWNACRAAMLQAGSSPIWVGVDWAKGCEPGNSPVIPDGYVMVPKEPTEAMMLHKSGCQHHAWDDPDCAMRQTRRLIWSHMLAAAPQEVK